MGFEMFDVMEQLFPFLFIAVFGAILFVIVTVIIKGLRQWSKNNNSPVLIVEARVVNMRQDTRVNHHHANDGHMASHHSSTRYYATFQVDSGDRIELAVSGKECGMLAQGDAGKLTFQGTRYLGFQRT